MHRGVPPHPYDASFWTPLSLLFGAPISSSFLFPFWFRFWHPKGAPKCAKMHPTRVQFLSCFWSCVFVFFCPIFGDLLDYKIARICCFSNVFPSFLRSRMSSLPSLLPHCYVSKRIILGAQQVPKGPPNWQPHRPNFATHSGTLWIHFVL